MQSAVETPTHTPSTLVITASTPSMSISLMFWGRVRYSLPMIRVSVPCTWWGTMMFGNAMPMVSESS